MLWLKKPKFIVLSFCRLEDQYMNHWAKIKVSVGIPFWKLKKRLHFLVFPASRGLSLVLAHGPYILKIAVGKYQIFPMLPSFFGNT